MGVAACVEGRRPQTRRREQAPPRLRRRPATPPPPPPLALHHLPHRPAPTPLPRPPTPRLPPPLPCATSSSLPPRPSLAPLSRLLQPPPSTRGTWNSSQRARALRPARRAPTLRSPTSTWTSSCPASAPSWAASWVSPWCQSRWGRAAAAKAAGRRRPARRHGRRACGGWAWWTATAGSGLARCTWTCWRGRGSCRGVCSSPSAAGGGCRVGTARVGSGRAARIAYGRGQQSCERFGMAPC
jgi:hypothetical protein